MFYSNIVIILQHGDITEWDGTSDYKLGLGRIPDIRYPDSFNDRYPAGYMANARYPANYRLSGSKNQPETIR